jgi:hypothetical protein
MSVVQIGVAVAAPMISGMFAGDAAGDAASAQTAAADRASATQEAARLQQRQDLSPWTSGGGLAQNELLARLGLGGGSTSGSGGLTRDQLRQQLLGKYTTTAPGGIDRSRLTNNQYDPNSILAAADGTDGGLANYGGNTGKERWWDEQTGSAWAVPIGWGSSQSSIDEAGLNAAIDAQLAQQGQGSTNPNFGSLLAPAPAYKQFTEQDLNNDLVYRNTYKTALDTGLAGINQRAAAGGNYGSGAALKALTKFGAQTANMYTGDAYNRNLNEQNNLYNRDMAGKNQIYGFLSGVSQQGQSAAAGVGAAGLSTGNNIANNQLAAGNATSAGIVGGANAISGGISDATNAYQWNQLLNKGKTPAYQTPAFNPTDAYRYSTFGSGD